MKTTINALLIFIALFTGCGLGQEQEVEIAEINEQILLPVTNDSLNLCTGAPQGTGEAILPNHEGLQNVTGSNLWFNNGELYSILDGKRYGVTHYFFRFDFRAFGGGLFTLEILAVADLNTSPVGYQYQLVTTFGADYPAQSNHYDLTNSAGWRTFGTNGAGGFSGNLVATPGDPSTRNIDVDLNINTLKYPVPQWYNGGMHNAYVDQIIYSRGRQLINGTLTIDGITKPVIGSGIFERQFGIYNVSTEFVGIHLRNGPNSILRFFDPLLLGGVNGTDIEVYQLRDSTNASIIVDRIGSIVDPAPNCGQQTLLAADFTMTWSTDQYTSPVTGLHYPKIGYIDIPSQNTHLVITNLGLQELDVRNIGFGGLFHGWATVSGTYNGQTVSGIANVEFPAIN